MNNINQLIVRSILAGIMIALGGCALCGSGSYLVGSFLFSLGLIVILAKQFNLFTGKIGYVGQSTTLVQCGLIWFGNLLGIAIVALIVQQVNLSLSVYEVLLNKYDAISTLPILSIICSGIPCGMLMHIAADNWNSTRDEQEYIRKIVVTMLAVAAFIIGGFEHCIADMFYLLAADGNDLPLSNQAAFLLLVTVGNSIGGITYRVLVDQAK